MIKPRLRRFTENIQVAFEFGTFDCLNCSESGAAFKDPEKKFNLGDKHKVRVEYYGFEVYEGSMEVVRSEEEDGDHVCAIAFEPIIPEQLLKSSFLFRSVFGEINQSLTHYNNIPEEGISAIYRFKNYLLELKKKLDLIEEGVSVEGLEVQESYLESFKNIFCPQVLPILNNFSNTIHKIASNLEDEDYNAFKKVFRGELMTLLNASAFVRRSNLQPLGYAGDHILLSKIYSNQFEGKTLFEKMLFHWSLNLASSTSIRYRCQFFVDKFRSISPENRENIRISSVACGPANEVCEFLKYVDKDQSHKYSFYLFDQEEDALIYAKRNIERIIIERKLKCEFTYGLLTVKNIVNDEEVIKEFEKNFDIVYAAGLYDYLQKLTAKRLTSKIYGWLKPEGELIVANFNKNYPNTISDFIGDWKLICRDEKEMTSLIEEIGQEANFECDQSGIELMMGIKSARSSW